MGSYSLISTWANMPINKKPKNPKPENLRSKQVQLENVEIEDFVNHFGSQGITRSPETKPKKEKNLKQSIDKNTCESSKEPQSTPKVSKPKSNETAEPKDSFWSKVGQVNMGKH